MCTTATAEVLAVSEPLPIDVGPNHQTLARITQQRGNDGQIFWQTNTAYTVLESGMHVWRDNVWVAANDSMHVVNGVAVATDARIQIILEGNANTPGAVDLLVEGQRLRSHVIGLVYYNVRTRQSAWIALVKDCVGAVLPPRQAFYIDAFSGINADIRYTLTKSSFAQDIILRERIPPPQFYGLEGNDDEFFVEAVTEFVEAPAPEKVTRNLGSGADEEIRFGGSFIGPGKAFPLGDEESWIHVQKSWKQEADGRVYLLESAPYRKVRKYLVGLPDPQARLNKRGGNPTTGNEEPKLLIGKVTEGRVMPVRLGVKKQQMTLLAAAPTQKTGFVWDYELKTGSLTNVVFTNGSTFLIHGPVYLYGTNNYMEGACIKYTNNANAALFVQTGAKLLFRTGPHNYASFVSHADATIGEPIVGAASTPNGYYSSYGLYFDHTSAPAAVEYARFRNASIGIGINEADVPVRNCQFVDCDYAIYNDYTSMTAVENLLIHRVNRGFSGGGRLTLQASHLTIHECGYPGYIVDDEDPGYFYITNSIIARATNWFEHVELTTNATVRLSDSSAFAAIGGGAHYLTGNDYRNIGNTNVSASLLLGRRNQSTVAPTLLINTISANTNFVPIATRDSDTPDLGYGYDAIDLVVSNVLVTNAVVTLSNGVVIAGCGTNALLLHGNSQIIADSSPTSSARICRYNSVQEQATNWGGTTFGSLISVATNANPKPIGNLRFTHFNMPGPGTNHIHTSGTNQTFGTLALRDCEFHNGTVRLSGASNSTFTLTNNLFNATAVDLDGPQTITAYNNLFRATQVALNSSGLWTFRDGVFDTVALTETGGSATTTNSHNGYINTTRLQPQTDPNDITTNSFVWHSGILGHFYQPTNSVFTNKASRTGSAGLMYHHTAHTNQLKIGKSVLTFGYLYIALDTITNLPVDSDGDGNADYRADVNQNGVTEPNEINGLKLWLKADAGVSTNLSGVNLWSDQSGTNHASGAAPQFVPNAVNGLPAIQFDGSDDYLDTPSKFTATNNFTILAVLKPTAAHDIDPETDIAPESSNGQRSFFDFYFYSSDDSNRVANAGAIVSMGTNGISVYEHQYPTDGPAQAVHVDSLGGGFSIVGITYAGKQPRIHLNGTTVRVGLTSRRTSVFAPKRIGGYGAGYFAGQIAELILYDSSLSSPGRRGVERYLNDRYAFVPSAPTAPTSLAAFPVSSNQINLTWTAVGADTASFRVERKKGSTETWQETATLAPTFTSFFDTNLTASTLYYYRIRSENLAGESAWSNEASATTSASGMPIPLTALKLWLRADAEVHTNSGGGINRWSDQSGNENHAYQISSDYQVSFVTNQANGRPVGRFDGTNDVLDLRTAPTSNDFTLFVVARALLEHEIDGEGIPFSGLSGQRFLFDHLSPLENNDNSSASLSLGTNGVSAYEYQRQSVGGSNVMVGVAVSTNHIGIGFSIVQLNYRDLTPTLYQNGTHLRTGWKSWRYPVLAPSRIGDCYEAAPHSAAPPAFSGDVAEVLILSQISAPEGDAVGSYLRRKYNFTGAAPPAPANLSVKAVSHTAVNITWNQATTNNTSIDVERKKGTAPYVLIATVNAGVTNYVDTLEDSTTTHWYRLRARNFFGESAYSLQHSPPNVWITGPSNLVLYTTGATNAITASASDNSPVSQVEFFAASRSVGTDSTSPYSANWTTNQPGVFLLYAKATDSLGDTRMSFPIKVLVEIDSDGDGLSDGAELATGTLLNDTDTDDDTYSDLLDLFPLFKVDTNDLTAPNINLEEPPTLP